MGKVDQDVDAGVVLHSLGRQGMVGYHRGGECLALLGEFEYFVGPQRLGGGTLKDKDADERRGEPQEQTCGS